MGRLHTLWQRVNEPRVIAASHAVDPQAVINAQQQQLADAVLQNAIAQAHIADLEARLAALAPAAEGGEG